MHERPALTFGVVYLFTQAPPRISNACSKLVPQKRRGRPQKPSLSKPRSSYSSQLILQFPSSSPLISTSNSSISFVCGWRSGVPFNLNRRRVTSGPSFLSCNINGKSVNAGASDVFPHPVESTFHANFDHVTDRIQSRKDIPSKAEHLDFRDDFDTFDSKSSPSVECALNHDQEENNVIVSQKPATGSPKITGEGGIASNHLTFGKEKRSKSETLSPSALSNKALVQSDSVLWYLSLIGGDPLLRSDEEVELGQQISELLKYEHLRSELKGKLGENVKDRDLAGYLNLDVHYLQDKLRIGKKAKEKMVVCNLRLVVSIAKKYVNRGMPLSDLIQEGTLGLIRACEKFDSTKGFRFSTYATWWVRQSVSRCVADQSRIIRLPVHLYDTISSIKKAIKILSNDLGRLPYENEIADFCKISIEKLRLAKVNMQHSVPLDSPIGANMDDSLVLSDIIESGDQSPEDKVESSLLRDDLEHVVNSLTPKERDVVRMRYGLDDGRSKTLEEIGKIFDVSKERVRQIEGRALRKLRHPYRSDVLRHYNTPEG